MKKTKFIISFFVIMVIFLIIGESYQLYLDGFESAYYKTTMYMQKDSTHSKMVNDILDSALRNNVEVFSVVSTVHSTFFSTIDIYGNSNVEKNINENLDIYGKDYKSILSGITQVNFYNFSDIPDIKNINDFYLIGSKDNIKKFKVELISKYGGNHPKAGYSDKQSSKNTSLLWALVAIVILFLSFYDVLFQKKENFVRISLGERISKIIFKNVILDTVAYLSIFFFALFSLSRYTNTYFKFSISFSMILLIVIINAVLYLSLYFYNLKEIFSNVKASRKLLAMNYVLKTITVIITVFIISSNIAIIFEGINFYQQRTFFEEHKDYYYTNLSFLPQNYSIEDDSEKISEIFYKRFFYDFDATTLVNIAYSNESNNLILANKNALNYLHKNIKELSTANLKKDFYFILPEKMKNDKDIINNLKEKVNNFEGDSFNYGYDVIYYQNNIKIISIDEFFVNGSKLVNDPIIIYNNTDASEVNPNISKKGFKLSYMHDIMYKISDNEFNEFVKEFNLDGQVHSKTNVLEKYQHHWNIVKRIIYVNVIFSMLILFLELIIIKSILRLEYEVNAIELSIKKVLGYRVWQKNRKIVLMTVVCTLVSIIGCIIAGNIIDIPELNYISFGGCLVLALEAFVIVFYINKLEVSNIQKILKGGSL